LGFYSFNFTVWKPNFSPQTFQVTLEVVERDTSATVTDYHRSCRIGDILSWKFHYYDLSPSEDKILDGEIHFGNQNKILYNATTILYEFNSSLSCKMSLNITAEGEYCLLINTTTLSKYVPIYYVPLYFSKPFFKNCTVYIQGESPKFSLDSISVPTLPLISPNPYPNSSLCLNWNMDPFAFSYRLYRSTQLITEINSSVTFVNQTTNVFYLDIGLSNGTYYYALTAIDAEGDETWLSDCRNITIAIEPAKLSSTTSTTSTPTTNQSSSSLNPLDSLNNINDTLKSWFSSGNIVGLSITFGSISACFLVGIEVIRRRSDEVTRRRRRIQRRH
jgi:hypothetical protein